MKNKLHLGILIGLLIAIAAITAVAADSMPPDIDRVCMCTKPGACHWVVSNAGANGLTKYPDYYCTGGVEPTATWLAPTDVPPDPDPESTVEPQNGLQGVYSGTMYDLCSIDECSARETVSAGIATIAASVSGGE